MNYKFVGTGIIAILLIVLFFVVVIIDLLSIKARSYFVEDASLKYPSMIKTILGVK